MSLSLSVSESQCLSVSVSQSLSLQGLSVSESQCLRVSSFLDLKLVFAQCGTGQKYLCSILKNNKEFPSSCLEGPAIIMLVLESSIASDPFLLTLLN